MDLSPPQAPPAIERRQNQDAIDAATRLNDAGDWQRRQQADLPDGTHALASTDRQAILDRIDAFWSAPADAMSSSRRTAFADRIAWVMRDLATLRLDDGTLSIEDASLAQRAAASRGAVSPHGLRLAELMVGDSAYAGALVVSDTVAQGTVLLFTPGEGWEGFPDHDAMTMQVEQRIRQALTRSADIDGVTRQAFTPHLGSTLIRTRPIEGEAFDALVERIVENQKDKLREAWVDRHAATANEQRDQAFVDQMDHALHLGTAMDVDGMLAKRDALLVAEVARRRLADVPDDVRADWLSAHEASIETLHDVGEDADRLQVRDVDDLPTFARTRLGEQLSRFGVTIDPAEIVIVLDRSLDPVARVESLKTLFEGTEPVRIRLVDLAYQSMSPFDFARFRAHDGQGQAIPQLTDSAIRRIVLAANLGETYTRLIDTHFRSGEQASTRRELSTRIQRSRMRLQANEARLSYFTPSRSPSLYFDHNQRGYRWIEAILDSPSAANRAKVEGHDIVVRHITYRDVALKDILEIGVRSSGSTSSIILYTPDAPDGVTFREFEDRQQAGRRFLYHPAFREYLLDRLPARFAIPSPNGATRRFDIDGRSWVFAAATDADFTRTGEPFQFMDIPGNFLDASYDAGIAIGFQNAATFLRSADDANWQWLLHQHGELAGNNLLVNSIKGVFTAPLNAAAASWRLYDSLKAKDASQAFVDFTELYTHALGLLPYHALSRWPSHASFAGVSAYRSLGIRFRAGTNVTAPTHLSRAVPDFESIYLAKQIGTPGPADARGLLNIGGRQYLKHNGRYYGARFDDTFDTVRLQRPNAGPFSVGPSVRRLANGSWERHPIGLRGGSGRPGRARSSPPAGQADAAQPALPFTLDEQAVFKARMDHELLLRIPNAVSRADLMRQVEEGLLSGRAANLSAELSQTWLEATNAALDAVARHRQRPLPYPLHGPLDLSVPPPVEGAAAPAPIPRPPAPPTPLPPGYRVVQLADVPANLYFYDETPFYSSSFRRPRARHRPGTAYVSDRATITPSVLAPGLIGVRLTTAVPTSYLSVLRVHTGRYLRKSYGFAVRLDARGLAQRHMQGPQATLQLLEIEGSEGMQYVLRTRTGADIDLYGADFHEPVVGLGPLDH